MPAIMTHGIPMRFWNHREEREETVYLATLRSGPIGKDLRDRRRRHAQLAGQARRVGRDMQLVAASLRDDTPANELRNLATEQDALMTELRDIERELLETAEQIVAQALELCHGPDEATRIMDCLCDRQIEQAVRMLDLGEAPADFFDGRGTRSNAPGTGPAAATSGASSLKPATAGATLATPSC
ncbi:MAG: hypothetical protein PHR35_05880 [Kiritimatiellae bacterium]|nr:hypothetical protein [Kiritimatiellia bacterium]